MTPRLRAARINKSNESETSGLGLELDLNLRPVDLDLTISESEDLDLPLWDLTTSLAAFDCVDRLILLQHLQVVVGIGNTGSTGFSRF